VTNGRDEFLLLRRRARLPDRRLSAFVRAIT
jgi:hypothetical protein